jgi:hypothetical protein
MGTGVEPVIELPIKAGLIKPDEILSTEEAKARIKKRNTDIYVEELAQAKSRFEKRDPTGFTATQWARMGNVNTANSSWTASFNFGAQGR